MLGRASCETVQAGYPTVVLRKTLVVCYSGANPIGRCL